MKNITVLILLFALSGASYGRSLSEFYGNLSTLEPSVAVQNCWIKGGMQETIYDQYYDKKEYSKPNSKFQKELKDEVVAAVSKYKFRSRILLKSHMLTECFSQAGIEVSHRMEACSYWDSVHDHLVGYKGLGLSREETIKKVSGIWPEADKAFLIRQAVEIYTMDISDKDTLFELFRICVE